MLKYCVSNFKQCVISRKFCKKTSNISHCTLKINCTFQGTGHVMKWVNLAFMRLYIFIYLFNIHYADVHRCSIIQLSIIQCYFTNVNFIRTFLHPYPPKNPNTSLVSKFASLSHLIMILYIQERSVSFPVKYKVRTARLSHTVPKITCAYTFNIIIYSFL